jgi:hypothetical protein
LPRFCGKDGSKDFHIHPVTSNLSPTPKLTP